MYTRPIMSYFPVSPGCYTMKLGHSVNHACCVPASVSGLQVHNPDLHNDNGTQCVPPPGNQAPALCITVVQNCCVSVVGLHNEGGTQCVLAVIHNPGLHNESGTHNTYQAYHVPVPMLHNETGTQCVLAVTHSRLTQ